IVKSMLLETGGGDAGREKARYIEIVLRSGALPIKVDIMGSYGVPAALGEKFKQDAIFAGMLASLGVILIIFIRYRKPKLVAPVVFTGFSEVVIILGMASLIKWDIDLPAIAGIIAVIGTGMDNQIVILDEIIMGREKSLRYKIKNAFFIVIGSWLTLMAAMLPLFFIGFRMLQGFAVTTIIGATMGVFVTRPAYARIVQYLEVKR
ncbi:MAG: preprotein translocase subunit SecD, partial [Candidatus Hydrothermarchaeaceae archaeon]